MRTDGCDGRGIVLLTSPGIVITRVLGFLYMYEPRDYKVTGKHDYTVVQQPTITPTLHVPPGYPHQPLLK